MGFDIQRFPNGVDEELLCMYWKTRVTERRKWLLNCSLSLGAICGGVLQDPLQAPTCEHAFCGVGKKCVFI